MRLWYRLYFHKRDTMRFLGHLDTQDLFHRAIKRAGLPVAYSEGFNPHQLISFALPLPLGMRGDREMLDMELTRENDATLIISSLNGQLPEGITVLSAELLSEGTKRAAALVNAAEYAIIFPEGEGFGRLPEIAAGIRGADELNITKKTKSGKEETVNIRQDILELECPQEGEVLVCCVLSAGGRRNLKPDVLAREICARAGEPFAPHIMKYIRRRLII